MKDVHSVISFLYKKKQYLGVSGCGDLFEVFDISKLKSKKFLSKQYVLCVYLPYFLYLILILLASTFRQIKMFINFSEYILMYFFRLLINLLEPVKQVRLGDLADYHIKIQKGVLFAVKHSDFEYVYL